MPDVDSSKYSYVLLNDCFLIKALCRIEKEWDRKKLAAAKKASLIALTHVVLSDDDTDNDNDLLDSCDAMYNNTKEWHHHNNLDYKRNSVDKFCMALPKNQVFTTGFDLVLKEFHRPILGDTCYNYCYCPCSCKMSKWQKQFDVQRDYCSNIKNCTPAALFDHLLSIDDVYHKAIKFYLEELYFNVLVVYKDCMCIASKPIINNPIFFNLYSTI